jgi:hypothetical protein
MNNELEKVWKEAVLSKLEVLFRNFPEDIEEFDEKPQ